MPPTSQLAARIGDGPRQICLALPMGRLSLPRIVAQRLELLGRIGVAVKRHGRIGCLSGGVEISCMAIT
jgi:hypothetical protein